MIVKKKKNKQKTVLNRPKGAHWRLGLDNSHVWILEGLEQAFQSQQS